MEVALVLVAALTLGVCLFALSGRVRRARDVRVRPDELAGLAAGAGPLALAHDRTDVELDLEEGALDPDEVDSGELDAEPLVWDEGADDELG